jgi:hypothetical protein
MAIVFAQTGAAVDWDWASELTLWSSDADRLRVSPGNTPAAAPPRDRRAGGHAGRPPVAERGAVEIHAGLHEWYESRPCCMSKAKTKVKQALDAEKAATAGP